MAGVCRELPASVTSRKARAFRRRLYSRLSVAGIALLIGSFCVAQSAPSSANATFAIHDFTPDFWRFWEAARNQPIEQQAQMWQQLYVAPHQAVFDDLAMACKDQFDAAWFRTHYLPDLPRVVPQIRTLVAGLTHQLKEANARFLKTFPDMRWSGDVYVMASGYCFNGRAQMVQGRSALLFGVDATAALDPSASELDLSHVPLGMVRQVNDRRAELAADFLRRFESTAEKDAKVYFNDINSKDAFVPPRAGYQLGILVIRELSKQHSLQAMAHWSQTEVKPEVHAALRRISTIP